MNAPASVVTSLAHAIIGTYGAYALSRGAKTLPRRVLAGSFGALTLYSLSLAAGFTLPMPTASALFTTGLLFALAGTLLLLRFAQELIGAPLRAPHRVAALAALGLGVVVAVLNGWASLARAEEVPLYTVALSADLLVVFLAVLATFARGWLGGSAIAPAARAYMLASLWPLVPLLANIAFNLGWIGREENGLVRDLCVLVFMYAILAAYMDHASEPMSLRVRFVAGTLSLVLAVLIVVCEAFVRHPIVVEAGSDANLSAERAAAARLIAIAVAAAAYVIVRFPRLYRRNVIEPIEGLVAALQRVEAGSRDVHVSAGYDDEVGFLAGAFNRMVGSLAEGEHELRRQVAARSRELAHALNLLHPERTVLTAGTLVDERYRVTGLLGSGGMGAVYEVVRLRDGRRLALKVMHDTAAGARFAREGEIAAQLDHPNLVSVQDVGVWQGLPYLAMELVEGGSLEELRSRFGDVSFGLSVLAQAARGLSALHRQGVVHRDLKPANLLLTHAADREITVKITDFGIAGTKPHDVLASTVQAGHVRPAAALTRTGEFMGTLPYMAPEAARGAHETGTPADVFALGLIGWELLAGEMPFELPPVLAAMQGKPLPDPPSLPASVPPTIADVLRRCLATDPSERATADEMIAVLEEAAAA